MTGRKKQIFAIFACAFMILYLILTFFPVLSPQNSDLGVKIFPSGIINSMFVVNFAYFSLSYITIINAAQNNREDILFPRCFMSSISFISIFYIIYLILVDYLKNTRNDIKKLLTKRVLATNV